MVRVCTGDGRPAGAELERGRAFPLVPEPAHVVPRGRIPPRVGEHRRQLRPVPHQQHLRAHLRGRGGDVLQVPRGGHGRLVDDHQLPWQQIEAGVCR